MTNTITIPAGSQVVGEAWSTILGTGNAFFDYNNRMSAKSMRANGVVLITFIAKPVIRAGASGSQGVLEISDMIFSTRGPSKQNAR